MIKTYEIQYAIKLEGIVTAKGQNLKEAKEVAILFLNDDWIKKATKTKLSFRKYKILSPKQ